MSKINSSLLVILLIYIAPRESSRYHYIVDIEDSAGRHQKSREESYEENNEGHSVSQKVRNYRGFVSSEHSSLLEEADEDLSRSYGEVSVLERNIKSIYLVRKEREEVIIMLVM